MTATAHIKLLAEARNKDGELIHDLLLPCPVRISSTYQPRPYHPDNHCATCANGFIPNEDPMALIAAAEARGQVSIHFMLKWSVRLGNSVDGWQGEGYSEDFFTALANAMVKATESLAANWERCTGDNEWPCNNGWASGGIAKKRPCTVCSGTGFEVTEGD